MRTIKQLLELMLEHKALFHAGLCIWATNLCTYNLITYDEVILLQKYITANKPENAGNLFYWEMGKIAPRIKWINTQIENLKN